MNDGVPGSKGEQVTLHERIPRLDYYTFRTNGRNIHDLFEQFVQIAPVIIPVFREGTISGR